MLQIIQLICFNSLLVFVFIGCGTSTNSGGCSNPVVIELENNISIDLANFITDANFTLSVESNDTKTYRYSSVDSSDTTYYESASTSKLVTAAVILDLVKDGFLSLDDSPQDYIASWPTTGNLSLIKLRHLLSFTSGLSNQPLCLFSGGFDFEGCVENIVTRNSLPNLSPPLPGSEFYYGPNHMQVAGLMAIRATGLSSWTEVFNAFKAKTGLFATSTYDSPSTTNPKLAAGMHWNAREYLTFLKALYEGSILNASLISQMMSDQISGASIGNSPAITSIGEDWHYGFGVWIECHSGIFNCGSSVSRISSPGAFGAYPFIDFINGYFGILARQGSLGTFENGYQLFDSVSSDLETWSTTSCSP